MEVLPNSLSTERCTVFSPTAYNHGCSETHIMYQHWVVVKTDRGRAESAENRNTSSKTAPKDQCVYCAREKRMAITDMLLVATNFYYTEAHYIVISKGERYKLPLSILRRSKIGRQVRCPRITWRRTNEEEHQLFRNTSRKRIWPSWQYIGVVDALYFLLEILTTMFFDRIKQTYGKVYPIGKQERFQNFRQSNVS